MRALGRSRRRGECPGALIIPVAHAEPVTNNSAHKEYTTRVARRACECARIHAYVCACTCVRVIEGAERAARSRMKSCCYKAVETMGATRHSKKQIVVFHVKCRHMTAVA